MTPSLTHDVQLFDTSESLASTVGEFVREGLRAGDSIVLVVTAFHWNSITGWARRHHLDLDAALRRASLVVLDAEEIVTGIMRRDCVDMGLCEKRLGSVVARLAERGRHVRIFGEAVNVLARLNDFASAQQLEKFWNQALAGRDITLLCGYSAEHFGNPRDADALRHICGQHTHIHSAPGDILGNFLVKTYVAC